MRARLASGAARLRIIMLINSKGLIKPAKRASWPCGAGMPCVGPQRWSCVYRILDSAWTQRTDGVSLRSDEGPVQADSRRPSFALQVESNAGSRNLGPTATDQCAPTTGAEKAAPQQYRSFYVCLALSLVPLRSWRDCDYQARNDHSLAPRWVSSILALAIAQPCWQTEGLG